MNKKMKSLSSALSAERTHPQFPRKTRGIWPRPAPVKPRHTKKLIHSDHHRSRSDETLIIPIAAWHAEDLLYEVRLLLLPSYPKLSQPIPGKLSLKFFRAGWSSSFSLAVPLSGHAKSRQVQASHAKSNTFAEKKIVYFLWPSQIKPN